MLRLLSIALGGALGSVLRYLLSRGVYQVMGSTFPWGTLSVNLVGSLAIGFLWALFETVTIAPEMRTFILVGILGGFTTFSSFTIETFNLFREGNRSWDSTISWSAISREYSVCWPASSYAGRSSLYFVRRNLL